jgi:hypothetical protein
MVQQNKMNLVKQINTLGPFEHIIQLCHNRTTSVHLKQSNLRNCTTTHISPPYHADAKKNGITRARRQSISRDGRSGAKGRWLTLGGEAASLDFELEVWAVAVAGEEVEDVGSGADDDDAGGHHGEVRLELLVRRLLTRAPRDGAEEHLEHFSSPDPVGGEGFRAPEAARLKP